MACKYGRSALLIVLLVLATVGCSKSNTPRSYGDDDRWWNCSFDTTKDCFGGPVEELGIPPQELAYITNVLDKLPWYPKTTSVTDVIAHIGASPAMTVGGTLTFKGNVSGLCAECELQIQVFEDQIAKIQLAVPASRSLLIKHYSRFAK